MLTKKSTSSDKITSQQYLFTLQWRTSWSTPGTRLAQCCHTRMLCWGSGNGVNQDSVQNWSSKAKIENLREGYSVGGKSLVSRLELMLGWGPCYNTLQPVFRTRSAFMTTQCRWAIWSSWLTRHNENQGGNDLFGQGPKSLELLVLWSINILIVQDWTRQFQNNAWQARKKQ